jgi:hypothetical protein
MVFTLRSDPSTSEEEHFKLVLVQTEMERVKYLVRSYVRCRLSKVGRDVARVQGPPERPGEVQWEAWFPFIRGARGVVPTCKLRRTVTTGRNASRSGMFHISQICEIVEIVETVEIFKICHSSLFTRRSSIVVRSSCSADPSRSRSTRTTSCSLRNYISSYRAPSYRMPSGE